MESDSENEQFVVEPYIFEPQTRREESSESSLSTDEESDSEGLENVDARVGNVDWCTCGSCEPFPTAEESRCCREIEELEDKLEQSGLRCITTHDGFVGNCLNPDVIEVSFYEFLQIHGPIEDEEPIHEVYRYIAYRRLARWIWHRLRKHERRPLPACAVTAVRKRFPSVNYTGFRYAGHDL